jgi:hypothetical protein
MATVRITYENGQRIRTIVPDDQDISPYTPYKTSSTSSGSVTGTNGKYVNMEAANASMMLADRVAQREYLNTRFTQLEMPQFQHMVEMDKERLAIERANEAWKRSFEEAQLTGYFEGKPTAEWLATQADITGYFEGKPTLQRELSMAELTGYYNDAPTLQREQLESQTALELLNLVAQLRGPRNAFQQAAVLNNIPGGLQDMLGALAGKYELSGYGSPYTNVEPVTLANFAQDVMAGGQGYTFNPPGTQAPANAFNYELSADGTQVYPPGVQAPVEGSQFSTAAPMTPATATAVTQTAGTAPLPWQTNAENYSKLNPYNKELYWAQQEALGFDPDAAKAAFEASLPTYAGPERGTYSFGGKV